VHELDAERLAIGALQDRDDLADGGERETEHVSRKIGRSRSASVKP
jgi:hypothetical protein